MKTLKEVKEELFKDDPERLARIEARAQELIKEQEIINKLTDEDLIKIVLERSRIPYDESDYGYETVEIITGQVLFRFANERLISIGGLNEKTIR